MALGLIAALAFGTADYAGGKAAQHAPAVSVTGAAQFRGLLLLAPLLLVGSAELPGAPWLLIGTAVGLLDLVSLSAQFHALAGAPALLVAPLTASVGTLIVSAVALAAGATLDPLLAVGVAALVVGQILVFVPIRSDWPEVKAGMAPLLAIASVGGVASGLALALLGYLPLAGILWALLAERAVSAAGVYFISQARHSYGLQENGPLIWIVAGGYIIATGAYVASVWLGGSLVIAAALASQYPLVTVVLASRDGYPIRRLHIPALLLCAVGFGFLSAFSQS